MRITQRRTRRTTRQRGEQAEPETPCSPWRFGVPVVCLFAGLLLAATHGVSGGGEIRGSDSPRLVNLVREAQRSVDRLSAERGSLAARINTTHGAHAGSALAAIQEIIDAIHDGTLKDAPTIEDPNFGFAVPSAGVAGVPDEILQPRNTWADKGAYDAQARKLAGLFVKNFEAYRDAASEEILSASPRA